MENPETISLFDFFKKFPDEEAARCHFEARRWINGKYCPHCGSVDVVEVKDHKPMPYRCKDCRKHFSVRTDTVLEESRLPLQKWLMAMYMMTTARKGIPSTQLAKELGITQKSAWFLAQRIREAFMSSQGPSDPDGGGSLSGEIKADETYIGGKEMSKHVSKKLHAGRGTVGKTLLLVSNSATATSLLRSFPTPAPRPCRGSTPLTRTLLARLILGQRSVYVDEEEVQRGVQARSH